MDEPHYRLFIAHSSEASEEHAAQRLAPLRPQGPKSSRRSAPTTSRHPTYTLLARLPNFQTYGTHVYQPGDPRIPVPYSRLHHMLGAARPDSPADAVAIFWPCDCSASGVRDDGSIAIWSPCRRHLQALIDRGLTTPGTLEPSSAEGDESAQQRGRPLAVLLGVMLGIIGIELIVTLRHLQRAEGNSILDPLSGLYNRRGWERRAAEEHKRLQRQPSTAVIFMMDLNDLKTINDRDGHAAGDAALVRAARVILSVTRQHDVAARLGGDEFALFAALADEGDAGQIERRLCNGFEEHGLSMSIGQALVAANGSLVEAMRIADLDMYRAKRAYHERQGAGAVS